MINKQSFSGWNPISMPNFSHLAPTVRAPIANLES